MGSEPAPLPEPRDGHIGRKAVEMGLITAQQLREVLIHLSQTGVSEPPLLATTLVSRGLLTEAQVGVLSDLAKGGPPKRVGKYHVVKELGRGGMGVVYEAQDPGLSRRVALKTLLSGFDTAEETRRLDEERFLREARLCANLPKHPNIVGVYEAGATDGHHFIAMEYIEGRQFSEWQRKSGAPRRQQIAVLRDVALAVHHAHQHGVIHRDLKPANILVDAESRPHVTDFGLAKRGSAPQSLALTLSGEVMGTPAYMSPEQAEARKDIDHRSDVWSLGVMLYEILAGRVPFEAETPLKLIMKTVHEPIVPPSSAARNPAAGAIDPAIEAVCMKALAKPRDERHPSAKALADDLTRWIKGAKSGATVRKEAAPRTWLYAAGGAAAAIVVAALVVVGTSSPAFDVDDYVAQGQRLLAQGKFREAIVKFGRVLEEDPGNRAAAAGMNEAERRMSGGGPPPSKELAELDGRLAPLLRSESFGAARDLLAEASKKRDDAAWKSEIARRSDSLKKTVDDLFVQVLAEAEAAQRAQLSLEVDARRNRVRGWKWAELVQEMNGALAKVVRPSPPTPVPPTPSADPSSLVEQPVIGGFGNAVHSLDISPDGKTYLVSTFEGTVRLWDAAARRLTVLHEGEKAVSTAMSPDGKWWAAGYFDGQLRLWDATTRKVRLLPSHTTQILGLAFSWDSTQLISSSTEGLAVVWDVPGGASKASVRGHPQGAMSAAFSPSGTMIAVGSAEQSIRLWELPGGRDLRRLIIGVQVCYKVAFAPDGKFLFSGTQSGDLTRWDVLTGTPRVFGSHDQPVRGLAISPDGRWIASASPGDGLKLWDAASASLVTSIPHEKGFYAVTFSPRGDLLAAGSGTHTIRLWDVTGLSKSKPK